MDKISIISEYIAPWGLSKEDIPIHLVWEPAFENGEISVTIHEDLEIREFFNVEAHSEENGEYIISKLRTPNFFGFTVGTKEIINVKHRSYDIFVTFNKQNKELYSKTFKANIFRPFLSVEEKPDYIVIDDDTNLNRVLNVTLKLSGFGNVKIRNESTLGGQFIERAEPLYRDILTKMFSSFKDINFIEDKEKDDKVNKEIILNPVYIQNKIKEYLVNIEHRIFPLDIPKDELETFRDWVLDEKNKDAITDLFSRQIENLIIDSIIYYFDRNPEENIQLPQGKPTIYIEEAKQNVIIKLRYQDGMGNYFEPLEFMIHIDDKREFRTRITEIPMNTKWNFEIINPLEACEVNV